MTPEGSTPSVGAAGTEAKSLLKPLRIALAGTNNVGHAYLRAITGDAECELVAIADADAEARRSLGETLGVPTYEDFRSMLVESTRSGLDVIVVALEPYESRALVELAGRSGVTVLHKPTFARTASEAGELLHFFPDDGPQLFVPREWHYEPALADLNRLAEVIGPVHAVSARVTTMDAPTGWRGDSVRSGGGVLLNGAYECVDLLVELLGAPERVQAEASRVSSPSGPRTYDTEDAVAVSLRFPRDCVATLSTVRGGPRAAWCVTFHGTTGTVRASDAGWLHTQTGEEAETRRNAGVHDYAVAGLRAFTEARRGTARRFPTPGATHVATLATIDAAYLSIRTGAPESPRQFLQS